MFQKQEQKEEFYQFQGKLKQLQQTTGFGLILGCFPDTI